MHYKLEERHIHTYIHKYTLESQGLYLGILRHILRQHNVSPISDGVESGAPLRRNPEWAL